MSNTTFTQEDLQSVLKLLEAAEHIGEFHLKYGDLEVRLSRAPGGLQAAAATTPAAAPESPLPAAAAPLREPEPPAPAVKTAPTEIPADMTAVKSPMVGTFYRAPSPGAKPFVEIGERVKPDTVVCIIEVMKLMNSIPARVSGTVRQILVEDSHPVEFGQVLLLIEPDR